MFSIFSHLYVGTDVRLIASRLLGLVPMPNNPFSVKLSIHLRFSPPFLLYPGTSITIIFYSHILLIKIK